MLDDRKLFIYALKIIGSFWIVAFAFVTLGFDVDLKPAIAFAFLFSAPISILFLIYDYITSTNELKSGEKIVSKKEILDAIETLRLLFENDSITADTHKLIEEKIVSLLKEI